MDEPTTRLASTPPPSEAPLFGRRYRPLALLGSGGMGTVYLARDEELEELVAVKMLKPELVDHPSMLERFREEVRLARRVSSPFVARTHDLAEHEGRWFLTMQYVEGEALSTRLRRTGPMPTGEVVGVARDVCSGLEAVHAAGIVHRDLKPGNVLVSASERSMLTDFGIALRAGSHRTDGYGTPAYAAPEQLAGAPVDVRTDVFAMGALLYTMATGQKPFSPQRTGREPAPDPRTAVRDLPAGFASIVRRAMALEPGDRFSNVVEMRVALEALEPGKAKDHHALTDFVRWLGASEPRPLYFAPLRLEGVSIHLANAVRDDIVARTAARRNVRLVEDAGSSEAMLTGGFSITSSGASLHLELKSREDGYTFWSETFVGPVATVPQLATRAAEAIERAFAPLAGAQEVVAPFPSAEVSELFLEARSAYREFWAGSIRRSVELIERARALAPDHPLIVAWAATVRSRMQFFDAQSGDARELALRAVELAPNLPESRLALAHACLKETRTVEAVTHFVWALRLAPGSVESRALFARLLQELGAVGPALALAADVLETDPTFHEALEVPIRHHAMAGRMDLAEATLARAARKTGFSHVTYLRYCMWWRDTDRFHAHYARLSLGDLDPMAREAIEVVRAVLAGEPVPPDMMGRRSGKLSARRQALVTQVAAETAAFVGDHAGALASIEESVGAGLFDAFWIDRCPLLDPMRGSVQFERQRRVVLARALEALTEIERCLA